MIYIGNNTVTTAKLAPYLGNVGSIAVNLRELQVDLDVAVLAAFGWDEIDLGHGFFEVPSLPANDRLRFTISEQARSEVLRRLSDRNRLLHSEEDERERSSQKLSRARSTNRGIKIFSNSQTEFSLGSDDGRPASKQPAAYGSAEKIETFLRSRRSWLSKSDILAYVDVPDTHWNAAINDLVERGVVERRGERRSARYKFSKSDRE